MQSVNCFRNVDGSGKWRSFYLSVEVRERVNAIVCVLKVSADVKKKTVFRSMIHNKTVHTQLTFPFGHITTTNVNFFYWIFMWQANTWNRWLEDWWNNMWFWKCKEKQKNLKRHLKTQIKTHILSHCFFVEKTLAYMESISHQFSKFATGV